MGGSGYRYWDGSKWTGSVSQSPAGPGTKPETVTTESGEQQTVYVRAAGNGMAVAALVCGIVGAIVGLIPILFFIALPLGILAVIFGFVGRGRVKKQPEAGRKGMATAGIVTGVIAVILACVGIGIVADAGEELDEDLDRIDQELEQDLENP